MGDTAPKEDRLKVCLVISGAIALGSFESGVICELTRAARAANGPIKIDLIAGTSAGSITGAQVAKALLAPNPDWLSFGLWQKATLDQLTQRKDKAEGSPLSSSWIREEITRQLTATAPTDPKAKLPDTGEAYVAGPPADEVRMAVTLTDLAGNVRDVSLGEGISVPGEGCWNSVTVDLKLTSGANWNRVAELVLASSANPAAWNAVPIAIPDNNTDTEHWEPEAMYKALWARSPDRKVTFTDGGTVASANLPVGRAVRLLSRLGPGPGWQAEPQSPYDPYRLVLFVEPDPVSLESHPGNYSNWVRTALRSASIYSSQAVSHGDLQWIGETNRQIVELLHQIYDLGQMMAISPTTTEPKAAPESEVPLAQYIRDQALKAAHSADYPAPNWSPAEPGGSGDLIAESVNQFYDELDTIGQAGIAAHDFQKAMDALYSYLEQSPLGRSPISGGGLGPLPGQGSRCVTDRIHGAILGVAYWYYQFKCKAERDGRAELLKGYHYLAARHSPAGDRQWVCVTRIVPTETEPYSRTLGHFGGFLNPEWMEYDFVLGRRQAIKWLQQMFPKHEYVQKQLLVLPDLPKPQLETLEPRVWVRNSAALASVVSGLYRSAEELVPWVKQPLVRRIFSLATVAVGSAVVFWWRNLGLYNHWLKPLQDKGWPLLAKFLGWAGGLDNLTSAVLVGAILVAISQIPPMELKIRFVIWLWGLLQNIGRMFALTWEAFRPIFVNTWEALAKRLETSKKTAA